MSAPFDRFSEDGPPDGIDAETMAVPGGIAWRERERLCCLYDRLDGWAPWHEPPANKGEPGFILRFHLRDGQPDTTKPITAEWV